MSRKPRTRAERQAAEYTARIKFERGVQHLDSWDAAWRFAMQGPRSGEPAGSCYTNLAYFMRFGSSPDGADSAQQAIYEELVKRLGRLTPRGDA